MSVPFAIRCPKCKTKLTIKKEALIGKKAPCPKCKTVLLIKPPAPKPAAPPAAPVETSELPDVGLGKPVDEPTAKAPAAPPVAPVETSELPDVGLSKPVDEPPVKAAAADAPVAKMPVKPAKAAAAKKKPAKTKVKPPVDDFEEFDEDDDGGFEGFGDDFDDDFEDDEFEDETPKKKKGKAAAGKTKPAKGKAKGKAKTQAKGDKKKGGSKGLIIAVSVLGLALAGGAAWWLMPPGDSNDNAVAGTGTGTGTGAAGQNSANSGGNDASHDAGDNSHDAPAGGGSSAVANTDTPPVPTDTSDTSMEPAVASTDTAPPKTNGFDPSNFEGQSFASTPSTAPGGPATFDVSHLPLASEVFIRIDVESIYNAAPIQMLMKSPAISENIGKIKDEIGIELSEIKSVTIGIPDAQAIASQVNPMMMMGGPMGGMGGGPMGPGGGPAGGGFDAMEADDGGFGEMGADDGGGFGEMEADGGFGEMEADGKSSVEPGLLVIRLATAIDHQAIQSVEPKFVASSHAGTSFLRMDGDQSAAIWLPDETTVVTGPEKFVTASIDQGSAVPSANLSFVNPDANILISYAPKNPDSVFRMDPNITSEAPPPVKPILDNLVGQTDAISIGIDLNSDLGLVAGILCKSPEGAAKAEEGLNQLLPMAKGMLQQQISNAPAMQVGYMKMVESLLNSIQLSHDGHAFQLAGKSANSGQVLANQAMLLIPTMLPAIGQARAAAGRTQSKNNLKQLALSMYNWHDVHNRFPDLANTDPDSGKPLLSWRVHLLPFLEQQALYEQFHLDEAWDSPHNKALIAKMPAAFNSPTANLSGGKTAYLAVTGPGTVFEKGKGKSLRDITDGTSNTLMIVEVNATAAVPWTKPDDFTPNEENILTGVDESYEGGFQAAFCDGSVQFITSQTDSEILKAMFSCAGGEVINK